MDSFSTDLAPLKRRTTIQAFEAASWAPAGAGLVMTFPDLFDYHGDQGEPGAIEAFEFTLRPVADGFEMTSYHTTRASHLEDRVSEVATPEAAADEIRSIMEEWDYRVSQSNDAHARDQQDDDA